MNSLGKSNQRQGDEAITTVVGTAIMRGLAFATYVYVGVVSAYTLGFVDNALATNTTPLCGVMKSFSGDVQVLDQRRAQTLTLELKTALPCGSWVVTRRGWAQIEHASQAIVHLGENTLVQLVQQQQSTQNEKNDDHMILYKGHTYIQVGASNAEFRVVSATARARIQHAKVLVNFSDAGDTTQLISLEHSSTLENRFEPSKKIQVKAGEMTELDLGLKGVVPQIPKAISLAELSPQMNELRVSYSDRTLGERALAARRLASLPTAPGGSSMARKKSYSLMNPESYMRQGGQGHDPKIHRQLARKLAGGEAIGEKILKSNQYYGRLQKARVEVEQVDRKIANQAMKSDRNKERSAKELLIEQLSSMRIE